MLKRLAAVLAGLVLSVAHAADLPLSSLPSASALTGSEYVYGVQSGTSKKLTPAQFKAYTIGAGSMSVASGKTGTFSNTLTLAGTDGSTLNVGTGGTLGAMAYLGTSGVSAGSYTCVDVTVDAYGRATAISSGSCGGSSSLTATYLGFGDGSNALTGSSALTYAASSGLGITNTQTVTGTMRQTFTNASNGTSATSEIWMLNDTSGVASFGKRSSTFTTVGLKTADQSFLSVNGGTFLFSNADSSDFIFARGGTAAGNEVMRLGAGTLSLGVAGTTVGAVKFNNATSGSITVQPPTGALGTITATIAATTGTHYPNPMTMAGDIVIGGASGVPDRLAAGSTAGHVLTSNGAGVAPSYQAASGGLVDTSIAGGRLTLSSGNPVYNPAIARAVSGQDTSADTVTVTGHGWTVGTMVYSSATSGGLTASVLYYIGNVTTNAFSLHTTAANALAGTSKLDITGTVTANLTPHGVVNSTVYYTPYKSNRIALYDGSSTWTVLSFSELSIALSGLSTPLPFDVFAYNNSGTVALRSPVAWTNDTTRATALVLQDGVLVKSGATTDRYIGTFYTTSSSTTESSRGASITQIGGKRYVWNYNNRIVQEMGVFDGTATWSYTTNTWRQANGSTGNQVDFVVGVGEDAMRAEILATVSLNSNTRPALVGFGLDSTTSPERFIAAGLENSATATSFGSLTTFYSGTPTAGKHKLVWMENGADGTCTFRGNGTDYQSGLLAFLPG